VQGCPAEAVGGLVEFSSTTNIFFEAKGMHFRDMPTPNQAGLRPSSPYRSA
jgi:hypothetical protein